MINENLIFDIGMHVGTDTEFYLKKGFKVVSIEANPLLAEKGKSKFKTEIEKGQLIIIDKAISETAGTTDFFLFDNKDDWGTIFPEWNRSMDSKVTTIEVETITLKSILEEYGTPYYMKIDIEGADILCLKSLLKTNERPTFISTELLTPKNLGKGVDSLDILCHLKTLGYTKFLVSDQSNNRVLRSPKPSLEGKYADFSFDHSSSGLFGKELKGNWFGIDKISMEYLNYFYKKKYFKNSKLNFLLGEIMHLLYRKRFHPNGWYDVHATIQ